MTNNDNIVSIATGLQTSAISIIKISGYNIDYEINKIFKGKDLTKVNSHTINYGHIQKDGKTLDEVLISVMRAPNTHTGEDIIEINSHGGILITQTILKLILTLDIRLATPGEFSKRAYLNGKKTLLENENIISLIEAKNERALALAINSFSNTTENLIKKLREDLLTIVANIEVNIDYPEYEDINTVTKEDISHQISNFIDQIKNIISDSRKGEIISNGINTAIIGKPNVGKSTLLNTLSRSDKAIVTDIAGTTRDIVESTININDITLNLIDTAGIRHTDDIVEKIGIEKSMQAIEKAKLILYMIDGSQPLDEKDFNLYENIKSTNHIVLINKSDILNNDNDYSSFENCIHISLLQKEVTQLSDMILDIFNINDFNEQQALILNNIKHITQLENVKTSLEGIQQNLKTDLPIDIIEIDLKEALFNLGEILGLEVKGNLLDELFSRFCLGK